MHKITMDNPLPNLCAFIRIKPSSPTINNTRDKLITTEADEENIFHFNNLFDPSCIWLAKI